MAVYKSTRCYPFLNSIDPRVTQTIGSTETPVQYLKCKVDTSNKKVTGYKIRILDGANNVIFNPEYISPISELQNMEEIYQSNGNNSGLNGTYLYIPFFQSFRNKKISSYNAMYYIPIYSVDYIVMDQALCDEYNSFAGLSITLTGANNIDDSNWSFDSITNELKYSNGENPFVLDGETILEGQIILFASKTTNVNNIPLGFYQIIKKEVGNTWYTVLKAVPDIVYNNFTIGVSRGKTFHNTTWQTVSNSSYALSTASRYKYYDNSSAQSTAGFNLEGTLYKWEITLYQGDGIEQHNRIEDSDFYYIDYSNLDNTDYDMVASSGTILGSNSSRIQIANTEPFNYQGLVNDEAVLPGLKEGVLVLQGKRMSFGNFSGNGSIFASTRHYVQSYDSSYGHAYPIEGDVSIEEINNNNAVQFFKYSNNPDEIKEQDIVSYGIGYNITFYLYSYENNTFTSVNSLTDFASVMVNKRRYGISKDDLPSYAQNLINSGDKIIFTGQSSGTKTAPYQNGIYEVYTLDNAQVTNILFLKRAASYKTWGSYLGKIVFCRYYIESSSGGAASSINLESLAAPSSNYSLWDPDEVDPDGGSSELYFTREMPILLFENTFETREVRTFDLRLDESIDPDDGDYVILTPIDGIAATEGMSVIAYPYPAGSNDMKIGVVTLSPMNYLYINFTGTVSKYSYYYINQGKNYGKRIFYGMDTDPYWGFHTATLLKNTCYQTYISPFINVESQMKLKLLQGKKASTVDGNTSWIPIQNVHPFLYCIFHKKNLTQPLVSEKNSDTNTPWRYEIKTFFKVSDENPFYSYEMPYLILSKNNAVYSSLLRDPDEEYWVTEVGEGTFPFKVKTDLTTDPSIYQNFVFNSFKDADVVYGRSVKFSANYVQFDGLSWESYRWTLYSKNGDLLQDTGKKYDKSIAVIFYGLSDDSSGAKSTYYAVLEVEDEKQNKIIYIIKFFVEAAKKVNTNLDFRATVDCDIHAVKLDFSQYKFLKPSFRDAVDNVDNSILDKYGTEGGVAFNSNTGATIYNSTDAPVDYTYGSLIDTSDGVDFNELTRVGIYGLPYYTTFGLKEQNHVIDNSSGLFIETQEGDYDDNGQFYFETCMCLDPDFCGSMVSWSVEKQYSDSDEYPYLMSNGTEFSKIGFINFTLRSADNFIFELSSDQSENYIANEHRNEIILDISIDDGVKHKSCSCSYITLFDIVSSSNSYYYLQPIEYNIPAVKTGEYEFLEYDLSYYPSLLANNKKELYIKKDKYGNFFAGGADYYFTNLCMSSSSLASSEVFPYWDEHRPHLDVAESNSRILNNTELQFVSGLRDDDHYVTTTGSLFWPTAEQEETLYWKEPSNIEESPILWSDVLATDEHVVQMGALKRHYGIENYNYHLICKINDIQGLYDQIDNNAEGLSITEASGGEGTSVLTLSSDGNSYGTIVIIKESN